jgi:hypothetical protein
MRFALTLILAFATSTAALATETSSITPAPPQPPAKKFVETDALADCLKLWDAGTHMTKQEWARTCKRVQTRLDSVKAENIQPDKGSRTKARTTRQ